MLKFNGILLTTPRNASVASTVSTARPPLPNPPSLSMRDAPAVNE